MIWIAKLTMKLFIDGRINSVRWQLVLEYTDEHYKNDSSLELKYEFTAF